MPGASSFAREFGLVRGATFDGWRLVAAHVGHHTVTTYREYRYPIRLVFSGASSSSFSTHPTHLLSLLKLQSSGERRVYSEYGNPYRCWIGGWRVLSASNKQVTVSAVGRAVREFISTSSTRFRKRSGGLFRAPLPLSDENQRLRRSLNGCHDQNNRLAKQLKHMTREMQRFRDQAAYFVSRQQHREPDYARLKHRCDKLYRQYQDLRILYRRLERKRSSFSSS